MTQKQSILTLKMHKPRQICTLDYRELKLRMPAKSSDVAGKLFQIFTTRNLQRAPCLFETELIRLEL